MTTKKRASGSITWPEGKKLSLPTNIPSQTHLITAEAVATHYGLVRQGREFIGECLICHYPRPSWSVTTKNNKLVMACWSCRQSLTLFNRVMDELKATPPQPKPKATHHNYIATVMGQCVPATGSLVSDYLQGRGFVGNLTLPDSLRFHPHLRFDDQHAYPAMVAEVKDIHGQLLGIHRTWLNDQGNGEVTIHARKMLGKVSGGAVHLAPAENTLGLCEGIETGLAAMTLYGEPVWTCLSAGGLTCVELPPLPLAQRVYIFADNDANHVGQEAAKALAKRLLHEGRHVTIHMPATVGHDFNDELKAGGPCRAA